MPTGAGSFACARQAKPRKPRPNKNPPRSARAMTYRPSRNVLRNGLNYRQIVCPFSWAGDVAQATKHRSRPSTKQLGIKIEGVLFQARRCRMRLEPGYGGQRKLNPQKCSDQCALHKHLFDNWNKESDHDDQAGDPKEDCFVHGDTTPSLAVRFSQPEPIRRRLSPFQRAGSKPLVSWPTAKSSACSSPHEA